MAYVITRDQVKTYLGISDSSYDTEIDRYIPVVDARLKQICRYDFYDLVIGNTEYTCC